MEFLPRLLAAGAILLGGLWAATITEGIVVRFGEAGGRLAAPKVVGKIVHYAVLTLVATMAAGQIGVETGLVTSLILIIVGVAAASVGLAFGLGARTMFTSIVARHYYEGLLRPGDRVTVGGRGGVIVRYTAFALVLHTEDGEQVIPCAALGERDVVLAPPER